MEDFNIFGDDFLSNGEFHQLYTVFDTQDENICLWDNRIDFDLNSKWNFVNDMSIEKSTYTDYSSCQVSGAINVMDNGHNELNFLNSSNGYSSNSQYVHNGISQEYTGSSTENFLTDMDEWKQNHLDDLLYHTNYNNEWELSLENLIMENPNDDSVFNVCDLPARTFYCNDSCTSFLQETSEHLDTSLRTFQPNSMKNIESTSFHTDDNNSTFKFNNGRKKYPSVNEEKEFVCNYGDCRKVYAKAGHLKAHIRRHIGDKPYVCQWPDCTWKFSRSDELSRHRRSHSGIKPYNCDLCPKAFSRSDHLTKHRKVHERKMAAMKIKTVFTKLPPRKPGRKPKSQAH